MLRYVLPMLHCLAWFNGKHYLFIFFWHLKMSCSKRGLILNVGSFSGAVPSPMLATYSGTKAFLATFSAALGEEVRQHNIIVEHINTYFVVCSLRCLIGINLRGLRCPRCLRSGGLRRLCLRLGLMYGPSWRKSALDAVQHAADGRTRRRRTGRMRCWITG